MGLLELLIVIILLFWILGFSFSVGGSLIHLLLLLIVILVVIRLAQNRPVL
jgi:hypothetical protein